MALSRRSLLGRAPGSTTAALTVCGSDRRRARIGWICSAPMLFTVAAVTLFRRLIVSALTSGAVKG